jgi:hypothetical protein
MIATMANGYAHIISHPGNPKYPVDIPAIAAAAAKYNVALEINNSSSFIRVKAAKRIAVRLLPPCVMRADGLRWVPTRIRHLRWANLRSAVKSLMRSTSRKIVF